MSSLLSVAKCTQETNVTIPAHKTVLSVLDLDLGKLCNQQITMCTAALIRAFEPLFGSLQNILGPSIADGIYLAESAVPRLPNPFPLVSCGGDITTASRNVVTFSGSKGGIFCNMTLTIGAGQKNDATWRETPKGDSLKEDKDDAWINISPRIKKLVSTDWT
jgi:hypothetical protein